jgi:hypothetical protein
MTAQSPAFEQPKRRQRARIAGPPKLRTRENAEMVCTMIGEGFTVRQVAHKLGCSSGNITDWRLDDDEFAAQYARAMDVRVDRFADELVEISDDASNDWMEREGRQVIDHEHVQRSRLRVDTRKWLMSKMAPKKYGERLGVDVDGSIDHRFAGKGPNERQDMLWTMAERAGLVIDHEPSGFDGAPEEECEDE